MALQMLYLILARCSMLESGTDCRVNGECGMITLWLVMVTVRTCAFCSELDALVIGVICLLFFSSQLISSSIGNYTELYYFIG